jgi:hypothetical protein
LVRNTRPGLVISIAIAGDLVGWHEETAEPARRRPSPGWARLIAKVYPVDPLL